MTSTESCANDGFRQAFEAIHRLNVHDARQALYYTLCQTMGPLPKNKRRQAVIAILKTMNERGELKKCTRSGKKWSGRDLKREAKGFTDRYNNEVPVGKTN